MATRSLIGMELEDGTVEAIYCHYDGYLNHNGRILINSYTTAEKVSELISLGGISSLGHNLYPTNGNADDVTVAYARDKGEQLDIIRCSNTEDYFYHYPIGGSIEYIYLFNKDGEWEYMDALDEGQVLTIPDELIETPA